MAAIPQTKNITTSTGASIAITTNGGPEKVRPREVFHNVLDWKQNGAPLEEPKGVTKEMHLYADGIKPGETLRVQAPQFQVDTFLAKRMMYSGSRDLWLMGESHWGRGSMFPVPVPLDNYRIGGEQSVDFTSTSGFDQNVLYVENRCTMRNARPATFSLRIIGVWYHAPYSSRNYRFR